MASEAYKCLIDDRDCENLIASEADNSLFGMK